MPVEEIMNERPMVVANCGALTIRKTPDPTGLAVGSILSGTEVIMYPREGAYPYVLIVTREQLEGFVDRSYLEEV